LARFREGARQYVDVVDERRAADAAATVRAFARAGWSDGVALLADALARDPELVLALADVLDRGSVAPHVEAMRRQLLRIVTRVDRPDAASVAVRLAARPSPWIEGEPVGPQRALGSTEVVTTRSAAELAALLDADPFLREEDPELGLLLAHDLLIRHGEAPPALGRLAAWAASTSHPLAPLPIRLLPSEALIHRALPGGRDLRKGGSQPDPVGAPATTVPLAALCRGVGRELEVDVDLVTGVFNDWGSAGNGRSAVRRRERGDGYASEVGAPPPALRADLPARRIAATEACSVLFDCGAHGGAYTDGLGSAAARLEMWRAVCGLLGRSWPTASIEELDALAGAATWVRIEPDDPWFWRWMWDLWLLVETQEAVAVIAGTDIA
jgi:hypothetical protein